MSDKSKIEWTDATWNPVTGCSKVSEGCRNCYAMTFAERFRGTPGHYFENGFDITLRPDKLEQPLRWKRPRRIFVNSMSDLFHRGIPDDYIEKVFRVMAVANHHTYQILTKRPDRMLRWIRDFGWIMKDMPHVWLGVSVENQKAADERIPLLLQTPAAVRFLSCEPLLGPVNLRRIQLSDGVTDVLDGWYGESEPQIDWVIVGGESGRNARPMYSDWARSLRDQCQASGVPFFFKQWGEWSSDTVDKLHPPGYVSPQGKWGQLQPFGWGADNRGSVSIWRVGKKLAGRILDGRTYDEMPV